MTVAWKLAPCAVLLLLGADFAKSAPRDVLSCHHEYQNSKDGKHNALVVTNAQWDEVKRRLKSREPNQIQELISARKGVTLRLNYYENGPKSLTALKSEVDFLDSFKASNGIIPEVYKGLLHDVEHGYHARNKRVRGDNWEIATRAPGAKWSHKYYSTSRVIFFCENNHLKIKMIAAQRYVSYY
jgi:hypothetical protein